MMLPRQYSWFQSLSVKKQISPFAGRIACSRLSVVGNERKQAREKRGRTKAPEASLTFSLALPLFSLLTSESLEQAIRRTEGLSRTTQGSHIVLRSLERVFRCYIACETMEDYKEGCLMVWANYMSPCNSIVGLYFEGTCDVISVTRSTKASSKFQFL